MSVMMFEGSRSRQGSSTLSVGSRQLTADGPPGVVALAADLLIRCVEFTFYFQREVKKV